MPQRILPSLMFQHADAEEAMGVYVALFADAEIEAIDRYGADEQGPEGTVKQARFRLGAQKVLCIDSPIPHAFDFTPSFSFVVECDDEAELDRLYGELSRNGQTLMPPGDYGFSRKFAWVADRFGVSWQFTLDPIGP